MKSFTPQEKHGTRWTPRTQLEDLEFTDDLPLLFNTQQYIQTHIDTVVTTSVEMPFRTHKEKSGILKYKIVSRDQITLDGETLKEREAFAYLGSIIQKRV